MFEWIGKREWFETGNVDQFYSTVEGCDARMLNRNPNARPIKTHFELKLHWLKSTAIKYV
jgi:hypothetical protein